MYIISIKDLLETIYSIKLIKIKRINFKSVDNRTDNFTSIKNLNKNKAIKCFIYLKNFSKQLELSLAYTKFCQQKTCQYLNVFKAFHHLNELQKARGSSIQRVETELVIPPGREGAMHYKLYCSLYELIIFFIGIKSWRLVIMEGE